MPLEIQTVPTIDTKMGVPPKVKPKWLYRPLEAGCGTCPLLNVAI